MIRTNSEEQFRREMILRRVLLHLSQGMSTENSLPRERALIDAHRIVMGLYLQISREWLELASERNWDLLPCTFCGEAPEVEILGGLKSLYRTISCSRCKCDLHAYPTAEEAVAKWNARVNVGKRGARNG